MTTFTVILLSILVLLVLFIIVKLSTLYDIIEEIADHELDDLEATEYEIKEMMYNDILNSLLSNSEYVRNNTFETILTKAKELSELAYINYYTNED